MRMQRARAVPIISAGAWPACCRLSGGDAGLEHGSSRHGLLDQVFSRLSQHRLGRLAINRLAADLQHHGHGQWRDMVQRLMDDSAPDAREHFTKTLDVEEAR